MERQERMMAVRQLYKIGVGVEAIAEAVERSKETIYHDIRDLGGAKALHRPKDRKQWFPGMLKRFAGLSRGLRVDEVSELLYQVLSIGIEEEKILWILRGVETTLFILLQPQFQPEKQGYAKLLQAVAGIPLFPTKKYPSKFAGDLNHRSFWAECLCHIAQGIILAPESQRLLIHDLINRFIARYREKIMPIWTDEVFAEVNKALATLTPREEQILKMLFGIGENKDYTTKEIGQRFAISRARVHQIKLKGLMKLRQAWRVEFGSGLDWFTQPIGNVLQKNIMDEQSRREEERRQAEEKARQEFAGLDPVELLDVVSELAIGTMSYNCLQSADIKYVGDLIQRTEAELLRIKNFGRKSLNGVCERLAELNLKLGMKLPEEVQQAFEEGKKSLERH